LLLATLARATSTIPKLPVRPGLPDLWLRCRELRGDPCCEAHIESALFDKPYVLRLPLPVRVGELDLRELLAWLLPRVKGRVVRVRCKGLA
jgi:hypothetical protein